MEQNWRGNNWCRLLKTAILILTSLGSSIQREQLTKKPHIIFFMADDLGWNDVGFHGMTEIPTPNIDKLAAKSVILNNHYTCPMCTPSRSAIFSGYYPHKTGLQHYVIPESGAWGLPLTISTLADKMKDMGYQNHLIGKWHLGFFKPEYTPTLRGFKSHYGWWTGSLDYMDHLSECTSSTKEYHNLPDDVTSEKITLIGHDLKDGLQVSHMQGHYLTDIFTDKAIETISEHNSTEPLFLFLAHHGVHRGNPLKPMYAPDKYTEGFGYIKDDTRRNFAGALKALDKSFGMVLEALEMKNMLKDSVVVFASDNGADSYSFSKNGGSNWPLRGQKFTPWEGGVKTVAYVWSESIQKNGIWNGLMHAVDWYPTILGLSGYDLNELPKDLDGKDMWNVLSTNSTSPREEMVLALDPILKVSAIRVRNYKLIKGNVPLGNLNGWTDVNGRDFKVEIIPQDDQSSSIAESSRIRNPEYFPVTIDCGQRPISDIYNCDVRNGSCLFDIERDPCEFKNLANDLPEVMKKLEERLHFHQLQAVKPLTAKRDYDANPTFHGGEWIPWKQTIQ